MRVADGAASALIPPGDLAMAIASRTYIDGPFRRAAALRLMIACPHTGNPVDTGYEPPDIPAVAIPHMLVDCLECGQDHRWRIEDAFVERY
jgi:hypothetical protein